MKRSTLSEIARLAGVNPSTVSRALNPAAATLISKEQRERIIALCDKLNYRPKRAARGCATGKSYTVGYVSGALHQDLSSPFISRYIAEISRELQQNGYSLSLLSVDGLRGDLHDSVRSILLSDMADGYIIGSGLVRQQEEDIFKCTGRPILTLGYHNFKHDTHFPSVEINIEEAVALIWQIIAANLQDHSCCFFGNPTVSSSAKISKIRKYAPPGSLVSEFFIPDPVNNSLMDYAQAEETAEKLHRELFARKVIWCGSDLVGAGLCAVMEKHGVEPGKDIMVIGYDHLASAVPKFPCDLATIDPCWEKAGNVTARKILELIANPEKHSVSEVINAIFVPGKTMPFQVKKYTATNCNTIFQEEKK
ncbi:MAG: LacI family transcriptional regulator [Lentisphaerae bacterium]|nr:LacI family transcriptional regulator [Lentisphaerota bacterium]